MRSMFKKKKKEREKVIAFAETTDGDADVSEDKKRAF